MRISNVKTQQESAGNGKAQSGDTQIGFSPFLVNMWQIEKHKMAALLINKYKILQTKFFFNICHSHI